MQIYAADEPAPAALRGAAVALGNFDGVHKGHQAVIAATASVARARGLALAAAVFEPHPRQVLRPNDPPFRLQSPGQRARALGALGVETVFEIRFDSAFAALSDEDFARIFLAERFGAAHVEIGFDFTFGRARMGNAGTLARHGGRAGFTVGVVEAVGASGAKVSSSAIREAIREGRVDEAAALLGRSWAVEGRVLPGAQLGRTLGFPTANLTLGAYVRPRYGIYAVIARGDDGVGRAGVASCGVRPTVNEVSDPLLEVFLLDFDGDLYGRRLEVEFIRFLRPEEKFDTLEAMQKQMADDVAQARAVLQA